MTLRTYTEPTVTAYTLLRKFLVSNGTYVGFLRNLRNDLTMHSHAPFCAGHTLPDIMCGNFLANYVEYEITHVGGHKLIMHSFPWSTTKQGHA